MKKYCLAGFLFLFCNLIFADESNSYWVFEQDVNDKLVTYYCVKTDQQLDNVLPYLVKEHLKSSFYYEYRKPNYVTMKTSFVSEDYIMRNFLYYLTYSAMFELWCQPKIYEKLKQYKYAIYFKDNGNIALIYILKLLNSKRYLSVTSYAMYETIYTEKTLDIMNKALEEMYQESKK